LVATDSQQNIDAIVVTKTRMAVWEDDYGRTSGDLNANSHRHAKRDKTVWSCRVRFGTQAFSYLFESVF